MGDVADGWSRADVRPSRLLQQIRRQSYEDKRPRDRYAIESAQLLGVLDERLGGCDRVTGADYGIADISCGVGCAT